LPASKTERVIEAVKGLLEAVPGAVVERNSAVPEKIPARGLIVLRDGDPGEPDTALGGFGGAYYSHAVEVEVYVEDGDAAARDLARPVLRAAARLHRDHAGRAVGEVIQELRPGQPQIHDLARLHTDPVQLEHSLCRIHSDHGSVMRPVCG